MVRFIASRRMASIALAVVLLVVSFVSVLPAKADSFTVTNPLIQQRADAQIYKHTDGFYYFTATVPAYDRIILRRATTIPGLASASEVTVWTKHSSGVMGAHIWAPEIHFISGKWYIYFAAGSTSDVWAIRMYVLENASANPQTGAWTERGQIVTQWQSFSLDATTFVHNNQRYLVWAQKDPAINNNSNLYIAAMSNPWTITGTPVRISQPTLAWEKIGFAVNEGPAVIIRNGKVFISYSAAATDANYCLGLLTASATANLLSASSWTKSPNPVFKSGNGVYGPGHNQFTTSPDGSVDILVYHGRDYQNITGDPLNDPNRHTRVQKLNWNADGSPNFGTPVANGTITISSGTVPTNTPGIAPTRTNTPVPGTFPVAGTNYRLINRNSGKVADVNGRSTADGANVLQWTSNGGTNQQWSFVSVGSGFYKVINRNSGKLLAVSGNSTADGGDVVQWTDNGNTSQQWSLTSMGSGYYRLTNRNSGKDLDVANCGTGDGADIRQWTWLNNNCQQWQITP